MGKVRTAATTAVVAAIALTTAPSAMASAGDDAHLVYHFFPSVPAVTSDSVQCPQGERALSGGVDTEGPISITGPLDETGSFSLTTTGDVPRYWYSAATNDGSGFGAEFDAVCSASSDATIQATTFTLSGVAGATATTGCPSGQRVVGGGVGTNGTVNARLLANQPESLPHSQFSQMRDGDVPIDWYAEVENTTAGTRTYEVYALCSPTSKATLQVTPLVIASGDSGQAEADCPGDERALSGGFGGDGVTATASRDRPAIGGSLATVGWFAYLTAPPPNPDRIPYDYAVFALCEGPSSPPAPSTGQRAAALKKCKKKHSKSARRKCRRKANLLPV